MLLSFKGEGMAKKIGAIVSLSIIGVLILATIIMANVNVNYSIKCEKPQYNRCRHSSVIGFVFG